MYYIDYVVIFIISFLIGSIPSGYIIAKIKGIDIKKIGSGNIGATNVYRVAGKKAALLTLTFDIGKGFLALFLSWLFFRYINSYFYISAISVILGHDFSIFLKFKGGKGVATTYGSILFIIPYVAIIGMGIWIIILLSTKYSSLAALSSFFVVSIVCILSYKLNIAIFIVFLYILMLFMHKKNIKRILAKKENKITL